MIDCPPTNNTIMQSAFLSADYYVIPTIPETISSKGLEHFVGVIEATWVNFCGDNPVNKSYFGEKPIPVGVFCTMRDSTVKYDSDYSDIKDIINKISETVNIVLFNASVADHIGVSRDAGRGDSSSEEYSDVIKEFVDRINKLES